MAESAVQSPRNEESRRSKISDQRAARRNRTLGVALMIIGMLVFSVSDVLAKTFVPHYGIVEVLFIRGLASFLILLPALGRSPLRALLAAPRPSLQLLRATLSVVEIAGVYWAFWRLPLADVQIYFMATPIFIAAMAPLLLREKVDRRQWLAILVGFVGVVIAMRPSGVSLGGPSLVALGCSLLYALMLIVTRKLRGTRGVDLLGWQAVAGIAVGVFAPAAWITPPLRDAVLLAAIGGISMLGYFFINWALGIAPASTVAPLQYTAIIWAALFGFLFFGDVPRPAMLIGAAVIIAAGLFIAFGGRTAPAR